MQEVAVLDTPTDTHPHRVGADAEVFQQILDPEVNLCLWQRPAQASIKGEVMKLGPSDLPDVRHATSRDTFDEDVIRLLHENGLDPSGFGSLRADMRNLARRFADVSEGRPVRIRFFTTAEDDCRRFHLDRTHLRMICTYQGPGTEWLEDAQVDRTAQRGGAPNSEIIRYGEPSQLQAFWVGLMKGDPANVGAGLVHRSPTIKGTGTTRVVLCLDS